MDSNSSPAAAGRSSVTLRLVELEAVDNPELFGAAEWSLRLWVNGLERWQSPKLKIREGEKLPIGAEVLVQIRDHTETLEVEVKAREHDLLTPDDLASGKIVLRRGNGFQPQAGEALVVEGKGALLRLFLQVVFQES